MHVLGWIVLTASLGIALLYSAQRTALARQVARWFFALLMIFVLLVVFENHRQEGSSEFNDVLLRIGYAGFGTFAGIALFLGVWATKAVWRRNRQLTVARLEFFGVVVVVLLLVFVIRQFIA